MTKMKNKHVKQFNEHQENKNLNISDVINSIFSELDDVEKEADKLIDNSLRNDIGYMISNKMLKNAEMEIETVKMCREIIKKVLKKYDL